ncbi:hypothetical protein EYF80_043102 [Liparis tanakae]|uniref:Uncharacterized protein n=1 Tax=Liparis tanakae TaxID=230148 RepID=A0A4Z2G1H2_9TELE|nr:hypothetical protein EYF80_043102 [Liparis tanakae]
MAGLLGVNPSTVSRSSLERRTTPSSASSKPPPSLGGVGEPPRRFGLRILANLLRVGSPVAREPQRCFLSRSVMTSAPSSLKRTPPAYDVIT